MENEAYRIFKIQLNRELTSILKYWKVNSLDEINGGFLGRRDFYNKAVPEAHKGIILNTRLLWTFSAASNFYKNDAFQPYAQRAYDYLNQHFRDSLHNGLFWELDYKGNPLNTRKQIYAQAFGIYALSEFYKTNPKSEVRNWAFSLFRLIEEYARDKKNNGYLEAFSEDWSPIEDMRLSEKDNNSAKTMNTHLHILEAYTNLFPLSKDEEIKAALENLIALFLDKFLDLETHHFQLFFNTEWKKANNVVSYGHDIEAAWLIIEACKAIGNKNLLEKAENSALAISETFLKEAYIKNGGIINEKDLDSGKTDTDRHWWPQMEALVGLEYAFKISGDQNFRNAQLNIWEFTKKHLIDHSNGEWHFRVNEKNEPYTTEDKISMWKAPYHNSRACMKLLK